MPQQPIKIFISYRRDDSQYVTDSIHDHLVRHFGEENVFLDVESIPFGVDFRKYISDQVADNDAVLVIIGPDWARLMAERADQPNDFVRIEIESALEQGKLIIPVLVKDAHMPDFSDLPAGIRDLQWLNSALVRRKPDLGDDCTRLAKGLNEYFQATGLKQKSPSAYINSHDIMPQPFDWIDIPAGPVTLQGEYGTFDVPAFSIAKYPVTVSQYEVFMQNDGYKTDRWWRKSDWQWLTENGYIAPCYWDDDDWQSLWRPDHPVVGISWFEAYAFTQWLSEKTGENIQLPIEQQWQRAAQGDDGRNFPWGDVWDASHCNNDTKHSDSGQTRRAASHTTSPVTAFEEKGRSPYGVVDMTGNVWEWTKSGYETSQPITGEESNFTSVLKGSSWDNSNVTGFQVTHRGSASPEERSYDIGFRIVRS